MKTRIFHTRFWQDTYILSLSRLERLAFIYLFTNPNANLCGIYELPDRQKMLDLDVNTKELEEIKRKFNKDNKFRFYEGWVKIINSERYNNYHAPSTLQAKDREMDQIPIMVIEALDSLSIDYGQPSYSDPIAGEIRNKKYIDNKGGVGGEEDQAANVLALYNSIFRKKLESTVGFTDNLKQWLKIYTVDDIEKALTVAIRDEYWKDKMTPTILCRLKNPRGERVDYIGDFKSRFQEPTYGIPDIVREELSEEQRAKGRQAVEEIRERLGNKLFNHVGTSHA